MKSFVTKAWSTLAVSIIAVTGLQADYRTTGQPVIIPSSGNACDPCCCDKPEPCFGYAYNPPVFFEDCCGWSADVEFLYWKPCQDGISYGSVYSLDLADSSSTSALGSLNGTQKYPKFEWDSGFRVGIGYRTPCDCWEVGLKFTHFRSENETSISGQFDDLSSGNPPFRGTIFTPSYSTFFGDVSPFDLEIWKVDTKWRVHFNQVDLAFSREFLVGRCVSLKPYAGLRSVFIEQRYEISREGTGTSTVTSSDEVTDLREFVKMSNDFKGVGLMAGFESSYGFGCGLAFYGNASGSLIYGDYDVIQRDDITFSLNHGASGFDCINHNKKDSHTCLLAGADLAFGLRWRQGINCDRNAFTLKLGWEHHVWFDYNKYRSLALPIVSNIVSNDPGGNLYFYGIVFAASVEF